MKYLNKFDTRSDYEASASTLDKPSVSYITASTEVIYNATVKTYIVFADPLVEEKCVQLYSSDGIGCTEADLAAVSALSASDWSGTRQNPTTYISFDELRYFTGLTEIPNQCFNYCPSLTSITIPNSVTTIGSDVFYGCSGLTSVNIGNSVTTIGGSAFYTCRALTSITIPASVTSIGIGVFATCPGLASITVESGNATYDSRDNCNAIIESATNKLITGCKNTVIPNSVTSIGNSAFEGCTTLTSVVIPNSVTSIDIRAFENCYGLASVTIGNSVTSIGNSAFDRCSGMTSVTIGNSVTTIDTTAFGSCKALTSVTIPASVTRIKERGFEGCSNLSSITFEAITPPTIEYYAFNLIPTTGNITVPVGSESNYFSLAQTIGANWTVNNQAPPAPKVYVQFADPLVASKCATLYGDGTGCTMEDLAAVSEINASDWSGTSITSFNELGYFTGLMYVSDSAFSGCTDLTAISIPEAVNTIGWNTFKGCTSLTDVTLNDRLQRIYGSAFEGCSALANIIFPDSLAQINNDAFANCSSLSYIEFISDTPPVTLGASAFFNISSTGNITVPVGSESNYFSLAQTLGANWTVNNQAPPAPPALNYVLFEATATTAASDVSELTLDGVTILGGNGVAFNYTNGYRFNRNCSFDIDAADGNITKIEFTQADDTAYAVTNISVVDSTIGTYTVADGVGTWEASSPLSTVSFRCPSGQARCSSIKVYFE